MSNPHPRHMSNPHPLVRLTERRGNKEFPVLVNFAHVIFIAAYPLPLTDIPIVGETKQEMGTRVQFIDGGRHIIITESVEAVEKLLQMQ